MNRVKERRAGAEDVDRDGRASLKKRLTPPREAA
jgi:hypothetical protein